MKKKCRIYNNVFNEYISGIELFLRDASMMDSDVNFLKQGTSSLFIFKFKVDWYTAKFFFQFLACLNKSQERAVAYCCQHGISVCVHIWARSFKAWLA